MNLKSKLAKVAIALLIVLAGLMGSAPPAHALSGSGYNNTDPIATGCRTGAYPFSSHAVLGGTASMWYSPRCGTNWIEFNGSARRTYKWMSQPVSTTPEYDPYSWAVSRQVYAPGTTTTVADILLSGGVNDLTYREAWSVTCASSCTWIRYF